MLAWRVLRKDQKILLVVAWPEIAYHKVNDWKFAVKRKHQYERNMIQHSKGTRFFLIARIAKLSASADVTCRVVEHYQLRPWQGWPIRSNLGYNGVGQPCWIRPATWRGRAHNSDVGHHQIRLFYGTPNWARESHTGKTILSHRSRKIGRIIVEGLVTPGVRANPSCSSRWVRSVGWTLGRFTRTVDMEDYSIGTVFANDSCWWESQGLLQQLFGR